MATESALEKYFSRFRQEIAGHEQYFDSPFGRKKILYADWTASGRAYQPIETCLLNKVMPFVGNTHSGSTITATLMTGAYEEAKVIVKQHVCADVDEDILIFCGSGMTGAVNKLQRILGLRMPERLTDYTKNGALQIDEALRPIVFVTHMEHYSNHTSWLETIVDVEIIRPDENGNVDLEHFNSLLQKFSHRKNKIAAITACSNVTGIQTPYHEIAKMIHQYDGLCFVDFACSAPYIDIFMHPQEKGAQLDAIYFSPHKFLGGPGTPGVLIFNKKIYKNTIPDQPGGGTLLYSNPWKYHEYISDIEQREDGGTPPFLQGIKAAMCLKLKEEMGVENILRREEELLQQVFNRFSTMKNVEVLEGNIKKRLGVISFIVHGAHYNLITKILNDRFGIQARGGCSCAGTYGHLLLHVDEAGSYNIRDMIHAGDMLGKPGWVRISLHPTMTNKEVDLMMDAIELAALHFEEWMSDYTYDNATNEYSFNGTAEKTRCEAENWFNVAEWDSCGAFAEV